MERERDDLRDRKKLQKVNINSAFKTSIKEETYFKFEIEIEMSLLFPLLCTKVHCLNKNIK